MSGLSGEGPLFWHLEVSRVLRALEKETEGSVFTLYIIPTLNTTGGR